jgi:uncharacterized membrane protein
MQHEHEDEITEFRSEQIEPEREERLLTFKATQLIWLLLGILEVLFALRILLKLIGANPSSPVAMYIYAFTGIFLAPFAGLIASPQVGNIVLEISTFFAMVIYALIAWAIERVIWLIFYRPRGHVVEVTETRSHEDHTQHSH